MRRTVFVLGRAIYGGYFIYNALNHFKNTEHLSGYAASKGTPAPDAAVLSSGAMMMAGGVSIAAGLKPHVGLALITACLVPVTLQMHRYWEHDDPAARQADHVNFAKNIALIGAALALMEVKAPWQASVESLATRRQRYMPGHTSYPRLSARELRSLPA